MDTIYSRLRAWRWQEANSLNLPSYFILSNAHLAGVAATCPTTLDELGKCPGVGPKKLAQFGPQLLTVLAQAMADGLEPGVIVPEPAPAPPEEHPLSEADIAVIVSGLQQELAKRLVRRFRGRFSQGQVEEALRRLYSTAS